MTSVSQERQRATVARLKQVGKELSGAWGSCWALIGKLKQRKNTSNLSFETVVPSPAGQGVRGAGPPFALVIDGRR